MSAKLVERLMPFTTGAEPSRRTIDERLLAGMDWSVCTQSRVTSAKGVEPHCPKVNRYTQVGENLGNARSLGDEREYLPRYQCRYGHNPWMGPGKQDGCPGRQCLRHSP